MEQSKPEARISPLFAGYQPKYLRFPSRLLALFFVLAVTFIIFVAEIIVMALLHHFDVTHDVSVYLDSFALTLLISPALYFFVFLPQKRYIDLLERGDEALQAMARGTSSLVGGEDFFRLLVFHLGKVFKAEHVIISERIPGKEERVRTLAFWSGTKFIDNIEYVLKGTPCENTVKGEVCYFEKEVQKYFPEDKYLLQMGIESYLGIPVFGSEQKVLGHIAILDKVPMSHDLDKMPILRIFAARVGAELEKRKAVQDLKKVQNSLTKSQEVAHFGNWDWDIEAGELWWSDETYRIFGMNPGDGLGTDEMFSRAVHPKDRPFVEAAVQRALAGMEDYSLDHRIVLPDGTQKTVHEVAEVIRNGHGQPVRMVGIVRDVTGQRAAEKELRESKEKFREFVEGTEDLVIQVDRQAKFLYVNDRARDIFGIKKEDCLGLLVFDFVHPDDLLRAKESFEAWVRGRIHSTTYECRMINRETGRAHDFLWNINLKYDETGELLRVNAIGADITERKRTDMMLRRLRVDLELEKQKLEQVLAIDQRIRTIRHLNHLVDFIIEKATSILEAEKCSLMLLDAESGRLSIRGAKGLDEEVVKVTRIRLGEDIAGRVARDNQPLLVHNIAKDSYVLRENNPRYKSSSFMSVPITIRDKVVGVVNVADKKEGPSGRQFSPMDLKILTTIVHQAGIAIENANYCRELEHLSITDALTGLFNHRHFLTVLDLEIQRSRRYPSPICLAMIDVDNFKFYNDTYGHVDGDVLLKWVGDALLKHLRKVDVVCRYAGDEFVVILPETEIRQAGIVMEKIREVVADHQFLRSVTLSIGLAQYAQNMHRRDFIRKADQALYEAKHAGKNKIFALS